MRTSDEARAILEEARQNLERLEDFKVGHKSHGPDALTKWRRGMPEPAEHLDSIKKSQGMTDAMHQRVLAAVDERIANALATIRAEIKLADDIHQAAVGKALGMIRAQLRQEMADEIGSLRADLTVEKAHAAGTVVDLPNPLRDRRA